MFTFNAASGIDMSFMYTKPAEGQKCDADMIQGYIRTMTTQDHPEIISTIMEELNLHKFWKKLMTSERYQVIGFLAADRMLNFYEAATQAGFDRHSLRIGLIVAAFTSTICIRPHTKGHPSVYGPTPSFFDPNDLDLADFDIKELTDEQREVIEELVGYFYKSVRTLSKRKPENAIKVFLLDAMKMWTVSKDANLKAFMSSAVSRRNILSEEQLAKTGIILQLGYGDTDLYQAATELTCFNTGWARAKSFKYNITAKVKQLGNK